MKKQLSIGGDVFAALIRSNCYYVDKTAFIKSVIEPQIRVLLMTRPRRFGKTLFMDTLKSFLQIDSKDPGNSTRNRSLFSGLDILKDSAFCNTFMGQHPVVTLSFKDVDGPDFATAYLKLAEIIEDLADTYSFLLESPKLSRLEKSRLSRCLDPDYIEDTAHQGLAQAFLKNLVTALSKHYERKVVLLIDEYDVPLAKAASRGYYQSMLDLIRPLLSQVLKPVPNEGIDVYPYLEKAVLTGCLRVSKESLFTGLNNFDINTVCSDEETLNSAIGFTSAEVEALLAYYDLSPRLADVRRWYDGYRFGTREIYCPWDVINFCRKALTSANPMKYVPENYWSHTSSNEAIDEFLGFLSGEDTDKMQALLDGKTIDITVNEKLNYNDLALHHPRDFWTLLLFSGYLTITERAPEAALHFKVRIPNREIREAFKESIADHFSAVNGIFASQSYRFIKATISGSTSSLASLLEPLLKNYVSVRDAATKAPAENFYQGFLCALCGCAESLIENFRSNGEAGDGYADITYTAWSGASRVGVVLELKHCSRSEDMPAAARAAVAQIHRKHYTDCLEKLECRELHAFGIAFCGKSCFAADSRCLEDGPEISAASLQALQRAYQQQSRQLADLRQKLFC